MASPTFTRAERAIVSACFALVLAWVSGSLDPRFEKKPQSVAMDEAVLHRQPFYLDGQRIDLPEFRNRLLMPTLTAALSPIAGGDSKAYLVLRVLSAWAMMLAWFWATRDVAWETALAGAAALAMAVLASFEFYIEVSMDFSDVAFMLAFCVLVRARRFGALVVTAALATFNRESAAFAGVLWACVYGGWQRRSAIVALVQGGAISVGCYALALELRRLFAVAGEAPRQTLGITVMPFYIKNFVQHPTLGSWPVLLVCALSLTGVFVKRSASAWTAVDRRFLLAAALLLVPTLTFGVPRELRVWLPVFAITIHTATLALGRAGAMAAQTVMPTSHRRAARAARG